MRGLGYVMGLLLAAAVLAGGEGRWAWAGETVEVTCLLGDMGSAAVRVTARLVYLNRTVWQANLRPEATPRCAVDLPELKPGVIATMTLEVRCTDRGGRETGLWQAPLYVMAPGSVAALLPELRTRRIGCFSPGDDRLATVVASLGAQVQRLETLSDFQGDCVVLAGLDFAQFPGYGEDIATLAARGVDVLVLPPFAGFAPLPADTGGELLCAGPGFLTTVDKRLVPNAFAPWTEPGIALVALGDTVILTLGAPEPAWRMVRGRTDGTGITYCAVDLVERADSEPAATWLLAQLLCSQTKREMMP